MYARVCARIGCSLSFVYNAFCVRRKCARKIRFYSRKCGKTVMNEHTERSQREAKKSHFRFLRARIADTHNAQCARARAVFRRIVSCLRVVCFGNSLLAFSRTEQKHTAESLFSLGLPLHPRTHNKTRTAALLCMECGPRKLSVCS